MGNKSGKILAGISLIALILGNVPAAFAETQWQENHPRRAQVNQRLNNQNNRIQNKVNSGQMSQAQAARIHREDHQIRSEERAMASQNGGHITKQEQRTLNRQENAVSRQIGQ